MSLSGNWGRSKLVHLLGGTSSGQTARQDFAERLAGWLSAFDAVKLHASCQTVRTAQVPGRPAKDAAMALKHLAQLKDKVKKTHQGLEAAIAADNWPVPEDAADAYPAHLRKHAQDLQRQMEATLAPLRAQLWQVMAGVSPRLRQLVELDAALAPVVAGQAQKMWAGVPALIEKQPGANPDLHPAAAVRRFWQQALLAELEVRMQPLWGLLEAFGSEIETSV